MIISKTLTSINLFPSPISSISLRLINFQDNLPLSGLAPYSWNSCFLGVRWSGWCLKSVIPMGYFVLMSGYVTKGFNTGSPMYYLENNIDLYIAQYNHSVHNL